MAAPSRFLGPAHTILTASNTYTGGTTITSGVLAVGADSNLGSGPMTISAGTLEITGSILSPRSMVLTGPTATVQIDATGNYIATAGATVSGSGGLTKSGPGTLDLTNATISYTGSTSVIGGILSVGSLAGNSALSVAGGATANVSGGSLSLGALTNAGAVNSRPRRGPPPSRA